VHWLKAAGGHGPLVIGYDARYGSKAFAERTAEVATGAGFEAVLLPRPLPTPVLAHTVISLRAVAGVMVTASHNPPQDNGYKVYLGEQLGGRIGEGAQIVPPADAEIEAAIRAVGTLTDVRLGPPGDVLDERTVDEYVYSASIVVPRHRRDLTVAYTPLHGVGGEIMARAFKQAGFGAVHVVAEQADPDPDFPTVAFPNPEEKGAMDLLLALATETGADIAIANDPDADRCAVAVPAADGGWRALTGDQLGALLADRLISRGKPGTYATTIVSSTMLRAICAARGVPYNETLTGFKWIVRGGPGLVFGYEEAIGYCVDPDAVRDKDGIAAMVLACDLAAGLKAAGLSLLDRLDALAVAHGVHRTEGVSVRLEPAARDAAVARLLSSPPTGWDVERPAPDVLVLRRPQERLVIRPSGTEPKLKAYLEVVVAVPDPGALRAAQDGARDRMDALRDEVGALLRA
jgi:phosphomannomutase